MEAGGEEALVAVAETLVVLVVAVGRLLRALGDDPMAGGDEIEEPLQVRQAGDTLLAKKDDGVLAIWRGRSGGRRG